MSNASLAAKTIFEKFYQQIDSLPNKQAFVFSGSDRSRGVTYQALGQKVKTIACHLKHHIKPNEKILLLLKNDDEFISVFLACLLGGAVPIVVPYHEDFSSTAENVRKEIDFQYVVSNIEFFSAYKDFKLLDYNALLASEPKVQRIDSSVGQVAFIQYTSGSTSRPKSILISHENIMANLYYATQLYGAECFQKGCCWTPLQHDMGLVGGVLLTLYVGATTVIMKPAWFLEDPLNWLKMIDQHKVTFTFSPNFSFDRCVDILDSQLDGLDLRSWKLAVNGGELIKRGTVERFIAKFSRYGFSKSALNPCYGLSETTMVISGHHCSEQPNWLTVSQKQLEKNLVKIVEAGADDACCIINCGKVLVDHEIVIVSPDTLKRLAPYYIGEIWVRGPSVASGYLGDAKLDQTIFHAKHLGSQQAFLRTGDMGFLDENNNIYVTGRIKNIFIFRGRNYYMGDIAHIISSAHPKTMHCQNAVFSINESKGLLGVIQEIDDIHLDFNEIESIFKKTVKKQLSLELNYIAFLPVGELPRTVLGKVQRRVAKENFYHYHAKLVHLIDDAQSRRFNNKFHLETSCLNEQGLFGALIPLSYGGLGYSYGQFLKKLLEVSEKHFALGMFWLNSSAVSLLPILFYGSEKLKRALFPKIARGEDLVSFSFTEVLSNADLGKINTSYVETSKGFTINGHKQWGGAAWATKTVVFARDKNNRKLMLSAFVADLTSAQVLRGKEYSMMGAEILQQAPITFKDQVVPASHRLSEDGLEILTTVLNYSRLGVSVLALAAIRKGINIAEPIVKEKIIASGYLIEHPLIEQRFSAAKSRADIIYHAADLISENRLGAERFPDEIFALIKAQSSDWANDSLQQLFFSLGSFAYIGDYGFEKLYKDALSLTIIEGSNDSLFSMVGRALLETQIFQSFFSKCFKEDFSKALSDETESIFGDKDVSNCSKKQRLALHYSLGKTLSPLILHLLLKSAASLFPENFDQAIVALSRQEFLNGSGCGLGVVEEVVDQATNLKSSFSNAKDSNEYGLRFGWIKNWCVENLSSSSELVSFKTDFFELGMDSLYAAVFIKALNQAFATNLEPSVIWEYSTIDQFIRHSLLW